MLPAAKRPSPRSRPGPALLAGLAGLASIAAAPDSSAVEPSPIPIVIMAEEGPDRELPTGQAFYLSGEVGKEVAAVYPVFVRISFPPLGIADDRSCPLALRSLSADQLRKDKTTPLLESRTGVFSIEDLWAPPPGAAGAAAIDEYERLRDWHDAYVPPAWVRPAKAEEDEGAAYKVLVAEPRFFRPGGTYCLFLYERHTISEQEKKLVPRLLIKHRKDRAACSEKGGGDAPSCASAADKELVGGLNKLLSDAGRERSQEVLFKVRTSLVNAAGVMSTFPKEIRAALDFRGWKPAFKVREDGSAAWSPPRDFVDVDADPFGRLLVELLASKGHIYRGVVPQRSSGDVVNGAKIDCAKDKDACRGRVVYTTRSGSLPIRFVRVRPGLEAFEVASDKSPSPAERDEIPVPAGALPIHGTGLTLEDAIEFARGRVKLGGHYLSLTEVHASIIAPFIKRQEAELEETGRLGDPAPLKELAARVETIRKAVSAACSGADAARKTDKGRPGGPQKPSAGSIVLATDRMPFELAMATLSGLWMEEGALSECAPYAGPARDPLASIAELIEAYIDAAGAWTANEDAMTVQITKISTEHPRRTPFSIQGRVTQETFFDNYVTPYLGRSILVMPGENTGMTYAGIQVYLWPNDVREPMWSNGSSDIRRLAGLELGVGLLEGDFGEDNRFSGVGPLPPLFLGAALHTLPYVTLSLGASLMDRRQSALLPGTSDVFASFYVGLTAQLNAVGIVRNLTSGRGASMAQEK